MNPVSVCDPLPKVQSRVQFTDCLEDMISPPSADVDGQRGRPRGLKTYIVESEGGFPQRFECGGGVSCEVLDTGIDEIKILRATGDWGRLEFFLDVGDGRFFLLHTNALSKIAARFVRLLTADQNHHFDNAWFHSDMLEQFTKIGGNSFGGFGVSYNDDAFSPGPDRVSEIENLDLSVSGPLAFQVRDLVASNPEVGKILAFNRVTILRGEPPRLIRDVVHNNGYFALKRGKSVQDHLHLVNLCKDKYAKTIKEVESLRIGIRSEGDKAIAEGGAFGFEFNDEIEDLELFIGNMFNAAEPFKLWGLKSKIGDDYYKVAAVDLHADSIVNFDIAKDMMRAYLYKGGCGNTILRLLTNLQIHFCSKTRCRQLSN